MLLPARWKSWKSIQASKLFDGFRSGCSPYEATRRRTGKEPHSGRTALRATNASNGFKEDTMHGSVDVVSEADEENCDAFILRWLRRWILQVFRIAGWPIDE